VTSRLKDVASVFTTMTIALLNAIPAKYLDGKSNEKEKDQSSTDWNRNSSSFKPHFIVTVACRCLCCATEVESIFTCIEYGTCKNAKNYTQYIFYCYDEVRLCLCGSIAINRTMSEYGAALSMETVTIQKIRKNTFFIVMISVTMFLRKCSH
jgi:hypothetical protein